jgi:hypothetical protein
MSLMVIFAAAICFAPVHGAAWARHAIVLVRTIIAANAKVTADLGIDTSYLGLLLPRRTPAAMIADFSELP